MGFLINEIAQHAKPLLDKKRSAAALHVSKTPPPPVSPLLSGDRPAPPSGQSAISAVDFLHEIGSRMAASDPLHTVLNRIVDFACSVINCDSCFVYVLEDNQLVLRASKNPHTDIVDRLGIWLGTGNYRLGRLASGAGSHPRQGLLQIREFQPKDIVRVLNKIQALGMTSKGSGADNIRNITSSPIAGIDPTEFYDTTPLADALHYYILNSRDMYGLPRKFNVAFDGGGAISVVADTNDIGFIATSVPEGRSIPAGVYFRVLLCGITGHKQFATDCGLLLPPEQTVAVAAAMIRVFSENGDRTDRKKARLKYLVDRWGIERFLAETEKRLAFPLIRFPVQDCEPRKPIDRAGHIGIHAQRQPGAHYIGISVPVGRLPVAQMLALADVAAKFGSGELRLTVWQNLLIPNIGAGQLDAAVAAIRAAGLDCSAGAFLRGTVACTGNRGCRYAATDTKSHAVELAQRLDALFPIKQPVNLHVTGCPHSCAQHYIGDIGLLGAKVHGEEGYHVCIGGGSDQDQGLARELIPAIAFRELPPIMERLFSAYTARCNPDESFLHFSRRHTIAELQDLCMDKKLA
jgi:ferredoxin-nitrite reductase